MDDGVDGIGCLREELIAKEKELSYVQEFLLEQDDDLRACLDRVGNLESSIAATPRRARNTAGHWTPPRSTPDIPTPTSRRRTTNGDIDAGIASTTGAPVVEDSSAPSSPDEKRKQQARAIFLAEGSDSHVAVAAPAASPRHRQQHNLRKDCCCGDPTSFRSPGAAAVNTRSGRAASASVEGPPPGADVGPEPRPAPTAAPTVLSATSAAAAASLSHLCCQGLSSSSMNVRPQYHPSAMVPTPARAGAGGGAGGGRGCRNCGGENREKEEEEEEELPRAARGRVMAGSLSLGVAGGGDGGDRVDGAERRAAAAEATAAACAIEATGAKDEAERLRLEVRELSRWREAVFDLRDAVGLAECGGGGRGGEGDADPVTRHAQWVASPALGTLLPRLQQVARDLLSSLAAARARGLHSQPAAAAAAHTPPSASAGAQVVLDDPPLPCPRAMEEGNANEVRDGVRRGALSETRVEGTRKPCTCCVGVSNSGNRKEAGMGVDGVAQAAEVAAGQGAGDGVVGKEGDSRLRRECETLRIVVDALREKDRHSQQQISVLQEEVFQASLVAVKQDALTSTLRKRLEVHESRSQDAVVGVTYCGGDRATCGRNALSSTSEVRSRPRTGAAETLARAGPEQGNLSRKELAELRSGCLARDTAVAASPGQVSTPPSSWSSSRRYVSEGNVGSAASPAADCRYSSPSVVKSGLSLSPPRLSQKRSSLLRSRELFPADSRRKDEGWCSPRARVVEQEGAGHCEDKIYSHGGVYAEGRTKRATTGVHITSGTPLAATTVPFRSSPFTAGVPATPRSGIRDRRGCSGDGTAGPGERDCTATKGERPRRNAVRTPTTDILRRLLYENTPMSTGDGRGGGGDGGGGGGSGGGRRLFGDNSAIGDSGGGISRGACRGPAALFADPSCGGDGRAAAGDGTTKKISADKSGASGRTSGGEVVSQEMACRGSGVGNGASSGVSSKLGVGVLGCGRVVEDATAQGSGRTPTGEIVLRERLLQARRDFSALRTGVSPGKEGCV